MAVSFKLNDPHVNDATTKVWRWSGVVVETTHSLHFSFHCVSGWNQASPGHQNCSMSQLSLPPPPWPQPPCATSPVVRPPSLPVGEGRDLSTGTHSLVNRVKLTHQGWCNSSTFNPLALFFDPRFSASDPFSVDDLAENEAEVESSQTIKGTREGKFLVYWMTTTSITTITSYSATNTMASIVCTPSNFGVSQCG